MCCFFRRGEFFVFLLVWGLRGRGEGEGGMGRELANVVCVGTGV